MSNEKKIIVDEIIHKFDSEDNSYFKLGSISGEVNEKGEDIIDHVLTLVIPKSKINKFLSQFNLAANYVEPVSNELKANEETTKKKETLGSPIPITHPKLR